MKYSILFIFVVAFLIRLIAINQSLWLDEATTARVVQQYSFWGIISKFSPNDFHPPLYYLFMKAWTNIFGYSEIALRMPSVLFSLLTGYVLYKMAKWLHGYMVGMWAAALFLFNPLIVYYSQEARMYMMATFFLTVSLYYLFFLCHPELGSGSEIRSRNPTSSTGLRGTSKFGMTKAIFLFNLFSVLAFVTFYGSIFLIIPMIIYLLYKKQFKMFLFSFFIFTFAFVLISPLLYQQFINAKLQLRLIPNWSQVLGGVNLKNLFLIPIKFSVGRISFSPKWLYWSISAIWSLFIWIYVVKGGLKNRILFFLLMTPLILGVLFSFFTPLLSYFRFLYLVPIMSLMLALGSARFHLRGGTWLILTGYFLFACLYLIIPTFHREDWRNLVKSIKWDKVFMIYSSSDPVQYYRKDIKIIDLKGISKLRLSDTEIKVIPYTSDIHGIDYRKILAEKSYKLKKTEAFRGLTLETWKLLQYYVVME